MVVTQRSNSVNDTRYLHKDHIGSIDAVTDEVGTVKELNSFSAWGERRNANWVGPTANLVASFTTRGFTGHEMEDDVGLINMNARLYDPVTGRFLQADTIIQFPESTQGFNRYTYVENNPLSYTDPTGHWSLKKAWNNIRSGVSQLGEAIIDAHKAVWNSVKNELKRFFLNNAWAQQVATIAIGAMGGGPAGVALFQGYITHISGGTWTDVGKAMAISFISSKLYESAKYLEGFEAVMANGTIGGLTSWAQGGKFGDGFRAAAVGKMVTMGTNELGWTSKAGQFVTTTIGGGIAAAAGGGKFEDGAKTAAMGYLFQEGTEAIKSSQKKLEGINVFRMDISLTGEKDYGHYWIEIDGVESYGWWPAKQGVGLGETFFGTEGVLNGQGAYPYSSATTDPHQRDRVGVSTFEVYGTNSKQTAVAGIRNFANSYSGSWSWPIGQNCHSFQEQLLRNNGLSIRAAQ